VAKFSKKTSKTSPSTRVKLEVNKYMRVLLLCTLFTLGGCESLGDIIREKKYNVKLHETSTSKQMFGYNDDFDYVGYMVEGEFGN
jgi:hypothetical protein